VPGLEPPQPTRLGEVVWLEPLPDAALDAARDTTLGPEARYEQTESISARLRHRAPAAPAPASSAVLVLRDVLGFPSGEVANMLDSTVESVNSALKRAGRHFSAAKRPHRPRAASRGRDTGRGRPGGEVCPRL
jgi:RNA polymerase sigma-70 factor (ECF subfamily)